MTLLRDDLIQLRAIEPEDLDVLYRWENNADWWEVGDTLAPFRNMYYESTLLNHIATSMISNNCD